MVNSLEQTLASLQQSHQTVVGAVQHTGQPMAS